MAVMPKVSQEALDYIRSWGVDLSWIREDGVERFGYYRADDIAYWPEHFERWPEGFDYDHLVSIWFEKPKRTIRTILIDMDGVIANWGKHWDHILDTHWPEARVPRHAQQRTFNLKEGLDAYDCDVVDMVMNHAGFYRDLEPIEGAPEALNKMVDMGYVVRVCTSPWISNETCASDKLAWLEKHIGAGWAARAIITSDKTSVRGDLLIDDKPKIKGEMTPEWEHILFDQPYNQGESQRRIKSWAEWEHVL